MNKQKGRKKQTNPDYNYYFNPLNYLGVKSFPNKENQS